MIISLLTIFLLGVLIKILFNKINLPSLIGMIIIGMVIGPYILDIIDKSILDMSSYIRQLALIIILTRAGLSLNIDDLKIAGRPALLMCFVPALFEIIAMTFLAPYIIDISYIEAALLGCVIAAVSPAVIVPKMLKIMDERYGYNMCIPQLILAGASLDDIFVIVLFTSFLGVCKKESLSIISFINIPLSIILGMIIGCIIGYILLYIYKHIKLSIYMKTIVLVITTVFLVILEEFITFEISFSALISIMSIGILLNKKDINLSKKLASKYNEIWKVAEIFLFVLVGASLNISYIASIGMNIIVLILLVLAIRIIGVYICLIYTELNIKEKVFCMIAYIPKATVQAAIGGIPLLEGLKCGNIVLTIAIASILITAPIGSIFIDKSYKRLLSKTN